MSEEKRRQKSEQSRNPDTSLPEGLESTGDSGEPGDASAEDQPGVSVELAESTVPEKQAGVSVGSPNPQDPSVTFSVRQSQEYTGPIPHPRMMAAYEEIHPGLADRIMTMAEEQAADDRKVRGLVTQAAVRERRSGQWLSTAVALATIVRDGLTGNTGSTFLVIAVLAGVYVFARLPEWWRSWRQPPGEEAQVEDQAGSDPEEPN